MVKIAFNAFKHINLIVLIALMLIVALVAGCVGAKAPEVRLDIAAKAASGLIISHNGGDALTLKDMKITVKKEINDKVVDGLNAVPLYGGAPEFQDSPVLEKLAAGQKIKHPWKESLMVGDVLVITIQDASGSTIVNTKVAVT